MLYTQLHVHDKGVGSILYACIRSLDHCDSYNANLDSVTNYVQQKAEAVSDMNLSLLGQYT